MQIAEILQHLRGENMSEERRRFSRIPFKVKAKMLANSGMYSAEEIKNLSIGCCLLPIDVDIESGTKCQITIQLSGASSELNVQVEGEIVRCSKRMVVVKFTRIDPDSLFHLRNIVRYNYPDSDRIEQEIHSHPGIVWATASLTLVALVCQFIDIDSQIIDKMPDHANLKNAFKKMKNPFHLVI